MRYKVASPPRERLDAEWLEYVTLLERTVQAQAGALMATEDTFNDVHEMLLNGEYARADAELVRQFHNIAALLAPPAQH